MASPFCRVAASFPSWRALSFILSKTSPYTGESILEQTILIFTRGVFVERFSCFREFVIRCAMDTVGQYRILVFFPRVGDEGCEGAQREKGTGRFAVYFRNVRD